SRTANAAYVHHLARMLPTMNAAAICRAVRERSTIPIIIISARSEPIDIVQALEAGADDYLTKPFDMQVLNARIRAVVRRFITSGTGAMGYSPASAATSSAHETVIGPGGRIISGGDLPDVLGPTPGFDSPRSTAGAPATGDDQSQERSHPAIVGSIPQTATGAGAGGGAGTGTGGD